MFFADTFKKTFQDGTGEEIEKEILFLLGYTVINVEQIEGLPQYYCAKLEPKHTKPPERVESAERFFAVTGARINHGGSRAFYWIDSDSVQMPGPQTFLDVESYYAVVAHEVTHWMRHPSRLDRDFDRERWGDEGYATEEFVAEIAAAFLCVDLWPHA